MGLYVCPAEIIAAPVETVWGMLGELASYGTAAEARVDFSFPPGWRGAAVQHLLGRELSRGPGDSLARLKRVAEAAVRRSGPV